MHGRGLQGQRDEFVLLYEATWNLHPFAAREEARDEVKAEPSTVC